MSVYFNTGFKSVFSRELPSKASEQVAIDQKPQTFQAVRVEAAFTQLKAAKLNAVAPVSGQGGLVYSGQAQSQTGSSNASGLTVRYSWSAFGQVQDFFA